jgi:hypothetical protein
VKLSAWIRRWLEGVGLHEIAPQSRDDALTDMIVGLIEMGADWQITGRAWWHPSGCCIWVANKDYGLSVKLESSGPRDNCGPGNLEHSAHGQEPISKVNKKRIWQAIQAHPYIGSPYGDDRLASFGQRIVDLYGNHARSNPKAQI